MVLDIAITQRVQHQVGFVNQFNVVSMEATLEELLYPLPPTALAILSVASATSTPASRAQKALRMLKKSERFAQYPVTSVHVENIYMKLQCTQPPILTSAGQFSEVVLPCAVSQCPACAVPLQSADAVVTTGFFSHTGVQTVLVQQSICPECHAQYAGCWKLLTGGCFSLASKWNDGSLLLICRPRRNAVACVEVRFL